LFQKSCSNTKVTNGTKYELRKLNMMEVRISIDMVALGLGRPVYALFHVPRGSKFTKGTEQGVWQKAKLLFCLYILYYYY